MDGYEIGKRVVCICDPWYLDRHDYRRGIAKFPKKGGVYTIRAHRMSRYGEGLGLLLVEIVNPKNQYLGGFMEVSFLARRFKPLDETRLDVFRSLLTPIKQKEKIDG